MLSVTLVDDCVNYFAGIQIKALQFTWTLSWTLLFYCCFSLLSLHFTSSVLVPPTYQTWLTQAGELNHYRTLFFSQCYPEFLNILTWTIQTGLPFPWCFSDLFSITSPSQPSFAQVTLWSHLCQDGRHILGCPTWECRCPSRVEWPGVRNDPKSVVQEHGLLYVTYYTTSGVGRSWHPVLAGCTQPSREQQPAVCTAQRFSVRTRYVGWPGFFSEEETEPCHEGSKGEW